MTIRHFIVLFYYPLIIISLLMFSGLTRLFRNACAPKKIQASYPPLMQVLRDAWLSLIALLFFMPSAYLCGWLMLYHKGFIYQNINQYGWLYFFFSLWLITLVHDSYYYWMHRLLHTRWLFKKIHAVHHRSRNPTTLSFFAMHPLESMVMAFSIPLCAFMFPMSVAAFNGAFALYMVQAIYAHSGFEWFSTQKISRFFTTSHSHNLHHQLIKANYSYFYNVWDRIGGTLAKVNDTKKAV